MTNHPAPQPGQIWEDLDARSVGRRVRVLSVKEGDFALVVVEASPKTPRTVGKTYRIALRRMRPVSNGYKLVEEVAADGDGKS